MNKNPEYYQQSRSEVEEICIYHSKHTQREVALAASVSENKYLVNSMPERIPSNNI